MTEQKIIFAFTHILSLKFLSIVPKQTTFEIQ